VHSELLRVVADLEPGQSESSGFVVRGVPVRYEAAKQQLICKSVSAPLRPADGRVKIEILVDRGSLEGFGNNGRGALSAGGVLPADDLSIRTEVNGTGARLRSLKITELKSAWK